MERLYLEVVERFCTRAHSARPELSNKIHTKFAHSSDGDSCKIDGRCTGTENRLMWTVQWRPFIACNLMLVNNTILLMELASEAILAKRLGPLRHALTKKIIELLPREELNNI